MNEQADNLGRKKAQATFATRAFIVVAVALGVAIVGLQLTTTLQTNQVLGSVRASQNAGTVRSNENSQTLALIRSCTTPGQPCFVNGQKQTAGAVADINTVVILAAACADHPDTQTRAQIQACVLRGLSKHP